jgi:hypothetical protein
VSSCTFVAGWSDVCDGVLERNYYETDSDSYDVVRGAFWVVEC